MLKLNKSTMQFTSDVAMLVFRGKLLVCHPPLDHSPDDDHLDHVVCNLLEVQKKSPVPKAGAEHGSSVLVMGYALSSRGYRSLLATSTKEDPGIWDSSPRDIARRVVLPTCHGALAETVEVPHQRRELYTQFERADKKLLDCSLNGTGRKCHCITVIESWTRPDATTKEQRDRILVAIDFEPEVHTFVITAHAGDGLFEQLQDKKPEAILRQVVRMPFTLIH